MSVNEKMTAIADKMRSYTHNENKLTLDDMASEVDAVYHAGATLVDGYSTGKQAQYDEFWDVFQANGYIYSAQYMFAGVSWNDAIFKPKHNMTFITRCDYMFANSKITDLAGILEAQGVVFSFSNSTNFTGAFQYSQLTHIGIVDTRKATVLGSTFQYSSSLHTIDLLKLKTDGTQTFNNAFTACSGLKNITIEGIIGNSINFASSPFSKDSITSVITALSSTSSGKTLTLKKTAVNNAFGIDVDDETTYPDGTEFYNLRHSKDNWTFNYV